MNIILSAINTKHTHSALSLACLKSYWDLFHPEVTLKIKEFDLNILNETIINDLLLIKPDILAFSTYIWSVERIIAVAGAVKAAFPECVIILGGPEVSYNSVQLLEKQPNIDLIIRGEGEISFKEVLEALLENRNLENIKGITRRADKAVIKNPERSFIKDLDELPSPFTSGNYKGTASFTYYEASRGCPSKCAYCLSSIQGTVRNHSMERVKKDLDWFFNSDFDQIRFADRTFNYDIARAKEIISYIKTHNKKCQNFHFEIQADFLSDEIIELLSDAPRGMFHLEIGVQSTNPKALSAVRRTFDLQLMESKIKKLRNRTKCFLHLDVLGGLPFDSYSDFCKSLDDVASLEPEDIQISLVKVLHGTPYEQMAKGGNMFYMSEPPYTILRTDWLAPFEAVMISQISKLYEGIGNSGRFNCTIAYLASHAFNHSYAKLYESLVYFWRENKLLFYNFSPENTALYLRTYAKNLLKEEKTLYQLESILDHELRMVLRSPNNDSWSGPKLSLPIKRMKYKLGNNLKGYWYKAEPKKAPIEKVILNYPIIYRFSRNEDGSPLAEKLELSLEKAFVLICIQKKIPLESYPSDWFKLYPNRAVPDFNIIIEELIQSKLLLYTSHQNL